MKRTTVSEILHATGWSLEETKRRTGLSINTLRSLSSGRNEHPQKRTRAKLAAALRAHSETLSALADQLDPSL